MRERERERGREGERERRRERERDKERGRACEGYFKDACLYTKPGRLPGGPLLRQKQAPTEVHHHTPLLIFTPTLSAGGEERP